MAIDEFVTQTYPIECKGRNARGKEVLRNPIQVDIEIYKNPGSNYILSKVNKCPHNTNDGERCKASHPLEDNPRLAIMCPYVFRIPYAIDETSRTGPSCLD
nr:hypothetical protein [Nanoarchaeum sp.]